MEKKQITLRIDNDIYEALVKESNSKGITVMDMLNIIIFEYFENISQV